MGVFFFHGALTSLLATWTKAVLALFGTYYLYLGLGAVLLMTVLAFLPFGKIKLGTEKPEFGWLSWIAMLYSTGMGGGLMLRAVQEPAFYFQNPPREFDIAPKTFALEYTFFHWGFTPWAFYGLMALIVSYNLNIKGGSALSSSALLGKLDHPWLAAFLDLLTVLCTLFGVVAGVGLGSRQLMEAISYWTGAQFSTDLVILPIFLVSAIAMLSAYFGVRRGISFLSNLNIAGATILLLFAWIVGASGDAIIYFFTGFGAYLLDFLPMSLNIGDAKVEPEFLKDWTYFYWAFWLSWAPFTGVFIARISKGRTIRELILGTLFIPALGTFFWFAVFGTNGMALLESGAANGTVFSSIYSSLFNYFSHFPFPQLSSLLVTVLVSTFLITSIDSAIFVLSIFSDEGKTEPRPRIRIFWGVSIFVFTSLLVWLGKDELLESVSNLLILFALPFSFVLIFLTFQFIRMLTKKS
ncbi:glycine betaine transporter OpuD [Algoriphagus jejuensis]|uniref:Glycine betaine transporter OpuD n=2 Tax=Algoriphagus jejuensis TaxID=419934 RepID=A0ABN1N0Q0_9BACT